MKNVRGVQQVIVAVAVISVLSLAIAIPAWANLTLSGTQTRGQGGVSGKLSSSGVNLPQGGVIASASDSGAGLWLQNQNGSVLRFNSAKSAAGARLAPGKWFAYPNLPPNANNAGCSVTISTTGSGTSKPSGVSPGAGNPFTDVPTRAR